MEVVLIGEYKKLMLGAFQIVLPGLKSFNNGYKFTIVRLVPSLCWNHFTREESYRMLLAQIIRDQLTENSTNSIAWYIGLNPDMTFRIKVVEDGTFDKCLPKFDKR